MELLTPSIGIIFWTLFTFVALTFLTLAVVRRLGRTKEETKHKNEERYKKK